VEGEVGGGTFTNKEGVKRNMTEIVANELFVFHQKAA